MQVCVGGMSGIWHAGVCVGRCGHGSMVGLVGGCTV